ncbi:MAG: two component transcriptional regulator, AraC family [Clostridia bacterium]|jgi:two-component system response regulator YesN|nr:two component transcriptional regulator, AraC family [Clostridia bacterium]
MKLKVMIVDDEKLERILISKSFEWEEHGFTIVAEADSGESATHYVKEYMPDIILTDINMPFMDGIAFATWVKEYHRACKVVMITGYREFEYAQKAIKIGVCDFLLKPISKKDISQILIKLKNDINKEKHQDHQISELKRAYYASESILVESFLQRLVAGRAMESEVLQKTKLYKLDYLIKRCICLSIKVDDNKKYSKESIQKYREEIQYITSSKPFQTYRHTVFIHYAGNVVALYEGGCEEEEFRHVFYNYIVMLKKHLKDSVNISLTMGVGNLETGIDGIAKSYNQSINALAGSIIYGKDSLIHYEEFERLKKQNLNNARIDFKEFSFFIENNLQDKAFECIDNYMAFLKKTAALDLKQINLMVANMISISYHVLELKGKNFADVFEEENFIYDQITSLETLDEMNEFLKECMKQIMVYLNSIKTKRVSKLIDEAQAIIDKSIGDSTLTLKSLAAYLYVNDSYLSRTFKKELGESVIEYITRKRIEKSIELFNTTNLKAYEVAEQVGINDPHYFGVCFKKYTGKTIKEFKYPT